jgi:murein DD-endopeptidase MepM/ murein hydrolase activator NlpD
MKYLSPNSFLRWPTYNFVNINLNQFFLVRRNYISSVKDPQYLDKELKKLTFKTYGGYGENRKDIWRGTYLDKTNNYIHLGVDINVNKGTELICPFNAEIINVFEDIDTKIGWGGRIILRRKNDGPFIILAHLDPHTLTDKKHVKAGDLLGKIGTWPSNGNTFEHLHLQLRTTDDFDTMDGYGHESELMNNPCPFTTEI